MPLGSVLRYSTVLNLNLMGFNAVMRPKGPDGIANNVDSGQYAF